MKRLVHIIISLSFLFSNIYAQEPQESIELQEYETETRNYVARDYIKLKSGFRFRAYSGVNFSAKIEPRLVFAPNDATYKTPEGEITTSYSEGGIVGAIPGKFGVSPSGAATYTIPIEVPKGINGMQPNISLVYNSQSGDGIVGWGWNIGGLSAITKTTKNLYYDNEVKGYDFNDTRTVMLDGVRLMTDDGINYYAENNSLMKIKYYENNGASYFTVESGDGTKRFYEKHMALNDKNNRFISWNISKIVNSNNAYVNFNYDDEFNIINFFGYNFKTNYRNHRISSIEYGHEEVGDIGKIEFNYIDKGKSINKYINNEKYIQEKLLTSIETYSNGSLYRKYSLDYINSHGFQKLKSVKLTSRGNKSYNPTVFEWSDNGYLHSNDVIIPECYYGFNDINNIDKNWFSTDIDGDGKSELVCAYNWKMPIGYGAYTKRKVFIFFKTKFNKFGNIELEMIGYPYLTNLIDLNVGGFNNISSIVHSGKFTSNNIKFFVPYLNKSDLWCKLDIFSIQDSRGISIGLKSSTNKLPLYNFGDLNNDGYDDILVIEQKKDKGKYPAYLLYGNKTGAIGTEFNIDLSDKPEKMFVYDFDSDGLKDIMLVTEDNYVILKNKGGKKQPSDKVAKISFNKVKTAETINADYEQIKPADFNNDGLIDFLVNSTHSSKWYLMLNQGDYNFSETLCNGIDVELEGFPEDEERDDCIIGDFDGNGKVDVITVDSDWYKDYWTPEAVFAEKVFIKRFEYNEQENNFDFKYEKTAKKRDFSLKNTRCLGDFNGDGRIDLMSYKGDLLSADIDVDYKFHLISSYLREPDRAIKRIKNGLDLKKEINYTSLLNKNVYTKGETDRDNIINLSGPIYVVNQVISLYDYVKVGWEVYKYKEGLVHTQGKGFLGFMNREIKYLKKQIKTQVDNKYNSQYEVIYPYKTKVIHDTSGDVSESFTDISFISDGYKRYSIRNIKQTSKDLIKGITSIKEFPKYNSYNMPEKIVSRFEGSNVRKTELLNYSLLSSDIFNIKLTEKTIQHGSDTKNIIKSSYSYNNKGNINIEKNFVGDINELVTTYSNYDVFGNPRTVSTTANGITRSTNFTYSQSGRFLKTKTNNQLGFTTHYNYNETTCNLDSETNHLGLTTEYKYNDFGQLKKTNHPDGTFTVNSLQWKRSNETPGALYYSYSQTSGESPVITWYDKLGHKIRKEYYGDEENRKIYIDTKYNYKGQVISVTEPYFAGDTFNKTTFTYDNLGRKKTVTSKAGTTTYTYLGLTTTVTSPSGITETKFNHAGQKEWTSVNGKKVFFTYHPNGQVKTSKPENGKAIETTFDLQGNRIKLKDPDAGTITSKYNGFGEIIWQNTPKKGGTVHTTYNYDNAGRLIQTNINGEITITTYNPLGFVEKIEKPGNIVEFTYDENSYLNLGRVTTRRELIENKIFETHTSYDIFGREKTYTYPSGFAVTNKYNKYGTLTEVVSNKGQSIWKYGSSNAKGQILTELKGGKLTAYGYTDKGQLQSIISEGIINHEYTYGDDGNIISREDFITHQKEEFSYTQNKQLKSWKISSSNYPDSQYNMSYDEHGNITENSNVGYTLTYNDPNRIHATTGIKGVPNNMHGNQYITYTDFNKVKTIEENNNVYELKYGVDNQRCKSEHYDNAHYVFYERYYLGDYEESLRNSHNLKKYHYISGGNGLAAIYIIDENNEGNLYYAYTDYLGSLTTLTNEAGNEVERHSYDPWGNRRSPYDWRVKITVETYLTNRGFTMHEHLDKFGLINMNGRVYDPMLGRFLSPDPQLQAPDNWLNYNRYAYCYNNPLMYTDPSGEYAVVDDIIASIVGGVINLTVNAFQGNLSGHGLWGGLGRGLAAFGAGAIGGWGALYPEFGGWAWGGATVGATNAWLGGASSFKDIAIGGGIGAISSLVGGAVGQYAAKSLGSIVINGFNISSPILKGIVGGTIGASAGGYGSGFIAELLMTFDINAAHEAGMKGLIAGAPLGIINGSIGAYVSAKKAGLDPWTGTYTKGVKSFDAKGVTAPKGWITKASKKGGGTVFKDPNNSHNSIRQMPGNPKSSNVSQQKPYVKFMKAGRFYDVNGNVLPNGKVPEAHIPLRQFNINNMPKF